MLNKRKPADTSSGLAFFCFKGEKYDFFATFGGD